MSATVNFLLTWPPVRLAAELHQKGKESTWNCGRRLKGE